MYRSFLHAEGWCVLCLQATTPAPAAVTPAPVSVAPASPPATPAPSTKPPATPAPTATPAVTPAPSTKSPATPGPSTKPPTTPAPLATPPATPPVTLPMGPPTTTGPPPTSTAPPSNISCTIEYTLKGSWPTQSTAPYADTLNMVRSWTPREISPAPHICMKQLEADATLARATQLCAMICCRCESLGSCGACTTKIPACGLPD